MITGLILLFLLLFLSAFFSGIESAFISLGDIDLIEIEKTDRKNAKLLLQLIENKERLLSVILIGNNLANIGASALATALAIHYSDLIGYSEELTITLAAVTLTIFILLFGEVTPKSIALIHNRKIALAVSPLVYFLSFLFYPASYLLVKVSVYFSEASTKVQEPEVKISESTVINVVSKGEELGVINEREKDLIEKVFLFDEREVYPIMTPRPQVFALQANSTLEQAQEELLSKQFSRIPIYQDSIDKITGVINLKVALHELLLGNGKKTLDELSQKALFIYETLPIYALLERFKESSSHLAVVVDEYGGTAGIVTLEDIIEELVGEIFDEKDQRHDPIRPMGFQKWLVEGSTDLVTLNREIPGDVLMEGDFESLQGLIMSQLTRLPQTGDTLQIGNHQMIVMKMRNNEILSVMIELKPDGKPNTKAD